MIAIAGTGAVGGTTGAYLRRAGCDLLLVDGWHQNVEAVRRDGLVLKGRDEEFRVEARAPHLDEPPANAVVVDLVQRLERGELARGPANLDEFAAQSLRP